jgi:hypothetical protein
MKAPRILVIGRQAGERPLGLPEERSGASYLFADDMTEPVAASST